LPALAAGQHDPRPEPDAWLARRAEGTPLRQRDASGDLRLSRLPTDNGGHALGQPDRWGGPLPAGILLLQSGAAGGTRLSLAVPPQRAGRAGTGWRKPGKFARVADRR